jgi:hypothetical protein
MTSFLALYRGESIAAAKIVAITTEPQLVHNFAAQMLVQSNAELDPVLGELQNGRRRALELVRSETSE